MSWTIYNKTGQIAKCKIHQLEYNGEFMGECSVVCTIKSESPIEFAIGDYLIYRGERFEINYDPTILKKASKNSTGDAFTYDNVKFNSLSDELARCDFLDYVPNDNNIHFTSLPKFSFFASSISNLAERIQVNLDRIYTGNKKWTVIVHPEYVNKKNINISVDTINVWDALALTNSEFEANFIIRGREITIGTAGIAVDNIFKYGKGKGLYEIERNAEADQKIVTRLRAYGSTRNMPDRYYNKLSGSSVGNYLPNNMAVDNLMLPGFPETTLDPYIDSDNIEELGIREGTIFFDGSQEGLEEIFPSIEGMTAQQLEDAGITVSIDPGDNGNLDEVYSAEQLTDDGQADNKGEIEKGNFTVTLKDIGFDINNYLLGETATLSMKDGMCGGRDFEITKCEKHGNKYILTCTRVYDDGIKLFFPYKNYNIKSGDKFVLLDISMPDVYIKAHSQRLLSSAKKWLAKNDYIRYSYIPKVDNIYMARQHDDAVANNQTSIHDTIKEGDLMLFEDDDLGISGSIIIDSLSIKEGDDMIPEYEITLKEEKIVGTLEKIQNQIDSIVSGGQGNGGYNSEQIKSLIKAFGSNFFLRKDKDDRTPHKLSSDKAFEIGKFVSGSTGGIIMVDKETGQTYAEVDKLKVRMKAYFESLEIQNVNSVGGKIVLTPGGAVTLIDVWTKGTIEQTPILSMADGNPILLADGSELQLMDKETVDNGVPEGVYRCFFLAEQDGVEVENRFRAGFQVQSKNFNIQKPGEYQQVANHYYWRLCVGASKEPINVGIYKLHYIDLSMADCDTGSDIPAKGDTVAHLGARIKWKGIDNKDVTDESNIDAQNAIVFSSTDVFSPSVTLYHGIDSYSYLNKEYVEYGVDKTNNKAFFHVYGDAYIGDRDGNSFVKFTQGEGVELKGKLHIQEGSTGSANLTDLPDEIYNAVQIGNENLLLNSGFTGDYDSIDISESTQMQADTEVYSPKIKYWEGDANIVEDSEAVSGYRADIGYLSQEVNLMLEEQYVISLRAKGTSLTVGYGNYNSTESLNDTYKKYVYKFTCRSLGVFFISGKASVCDIKLERGTIPTDWCPSRLDTDKSADRFKYLQYIQDAIKDGSVDILGGLILANMIQLGNYKNGKLQKVTAGISGIYNDDDDVAFWAGGTLQQAMRTIARLKSNPDYSPSDSEWGNLAKFIATHGGDIFLKGYIYAVGGLFRGRVETAIDGKRIVIDPVSKTLKMFTAEGNETVTMRFDRSEEGYEYGDIILKKYSSNNEELLKTTVYPERIRIENKVEKTDILIAPENVTVIGGNGEVMRVGMKAVYSDISSRHYISDLFSSNWPTSEDSVETGGVYMTSIPIGDSIISGVLRVKK
jgi:hypothetical protein